jgi:hypothetical protein
MKIDYCKLDLTWNWLKLFFNLVKTSYLKLGIKYFLIFLRFTLSNHITELRMTICI